MAKEKSEQVQAPVAAAPPAAPVAGVTNKQQATIDALEKQPKVSVMFPKMDGQPAEMVVTINRVRWVIPAGVPTSVPEAVAAVFNERLASEGRMIDQSRANVAALQGAGLI